MKLHVVTSIKSAAKRVAPGLLEALETYCRLRVGASLYAILSSNPKPVVDALTRMYPDIEVVRFIVREVFVKPILSAIQVDCEDLVNLFINRPEEFAKRIQKAVDNGVNSA